MYLRNQIIKVNIPVGYIGYIYMKGFNENICIKLLLTICQVCEHHV